MTDHYQQAWQLMIGFYGLGELVGYDSTQLTTSEFPVGARVIVRYVNKKIPSYDSAAARMGLTNYLRGENTGIQAGEQCVVVASFREEDNQKRLIVGVRTH